MRPAEPSPSTALPRLAVLVLVAGLALAGCAKKSDPQAGPSAGATALTEVSEEPSTGASAPTGGATPTAGVTGKPTSGSNGGSGNNAPTYPSSAKSYAQALLSAWAGKNSSRLDQLAVQAAVQQIKDNGYPNSQWTYIACHDEGADSLCTFRNAYGDEVVVKLTRTQLGHPTAVTEALLSRTEYSSDPAGYVGNFLYAWQQGNKQRMARYSTSAVTDFFWAKPKPVVTMSGGTDGTPGHTKVTYSVDGTEYVFNVVNQNLGKSHAISGLCNPTCA